MDIAVKTIHLIIAIGLIVGVLLQPSKVSGLSGSIAGGAETVFGKRKGRGIEAKIEKATTVVAILFMLTSIVLAWVVK